MRIDVRFLAVALFAMAPALAQTPAGPPVPSHVPDTLRRVATEGRKAWRPDAVAEKLEFQWSPDNPPYKFVWLRATLFSPSNATRRLVHVGGPYDGQIHDVRAYEGQNKVTALPEDITLDLPEALQSMRHFRQNGSLTLVELKMLGAKGTTPLAVWRIATRYGSFFALALDAHTGKPVPWQRVYNPPNGSDAEIAAAWAKLFPKQGGANDAEASTCRFTGGIWYDEMRLCTSKGGDFVDPYVGFR